MSKTVADKEHMVFFGMIPGYFSLGSCPGLLAGCQVCLKLCLVLEGNLQPQLQCSKLLLSLWHVNGGALSHLSTLDICGLQVG